MTGYGKSVLQLPTKKISIELKSLNSKSLDLNARMPSMYRAKELSIRKLLAEKWQLPTQLQAIIKFHHTKDANRREGSSPEVNKMIDIVYLANILIHAFKFGNSGHSKVLGAPKDVMERLTIDPGAGFKEVVKGIKENLSLADDFLRVIGGGE